MVYVCPKFDSECPEIEAHRCQECPRPRRFKPDEVSTLRTQLADAAALRDSLYSDLASLRAQLAEMTRVLREAHKRVDEFLLGASVRGTEGLCAWNANTSAQAIMRRMCAMDKSIEVVAFKTAEQAFIDSMCAYETCMNEPAALRAAIAAYRDAEIERLTAELAQLKSVPNTIYKAVEQVLDENSAWIARPSAEVTRRVAMAAGIVWAVQLEEKLGDAFQREQLVQGLRDYIRQLEMGMDDLRAKLEASNKELREIAESINDPRVNLTMTAAEWCIEAQSKLEAAERDAERYREWKRAFREGEVGLWNAICEANSDAEHDAAIDAARGGERG